MPATCTSRDATNLQTLIYDRLYKPGGRGIVGVPGINGTDWPIDGNDGTYVAAGYPKIALDSGALWGNATHQTRIGNGRSALITFGATNGPVFLMAGSMGAAGALNYAKANPANVKALILAIPAVDIQDIYDNNRNGYAASISTAHGGRPTDALTPARNAASFTGTPTLIAYSTDDPICTSTTVTAFGTAIGATMVNLGAQGHSAATLGTSTVLSFLAANA